MSLCSFILRSYFHYHIVFLSCMLPLRANHLTLTLSSFVRLHLCHFPSLIHLPNPRVTNPRVASISTPRVPFLPLSYPTPLLYSPLRPPYSSSLRCAHSSSLYPRCTRCVSTQLLSLHCLFPSLPFSPALPSRSTFSPCLSTCAAVCVRRSALCALPTR